MSESEIEITIERAVDKLDAAFMAGKLTRAEYDKEISTLDKWGTQQLNRSKT